MKKKALQLLDRVIGTGRTNRLIALSIILIIFLICPFLQNRQAYVFSMVGGALGATSSLIVIIGVSYTPLEKRNSSLILLYWRAVCDLGLGLRFLCYYLQNLYVCGRYQCYLTTGPYRGIPTRYEGRCNVPAAVLEFFEIASEGWFICLAIDLAISISNPFSSFPDRLDLFSILFYFILPLLKIYVFLLY